MDCYLSADRILLEDFARHAEHTSARLITESLAHARVLGREIRYLDSANLREEDVAQQIAHRDGIRDGLICVLKCVGPCLSFEVHGSRERRRPEIHSRQRECLRLCHYYQHPAFGFMHARIQTWFPFAVQVCLNGREWLARQMDAAGLGYVRRDNCFTALEDAAVAQALFGRQSRADWPALLDDVLRQIHPSHPEILGRLPINYYRSVHQSEWASDVTFKDRADLRAIHPLLVRHALATYGSACVMRLLGRAVPRRYVRGLTPLSAQGGALSEAVAKPEFVVSGMRNRDVVRLLYERAAGEAERRRRASRVTRQLRMPRAHGLLHKVPRSHRYQVSDEGRKAITTPLAARHANAETLTSQAA